MDQEVQTGPQGYEDDVKIRWGSCAFCNDQSFKVAPCTEPLHLKEASPLVRTPICLKGLFCRQKPSVMTYTGKIWNCYSLTSFLDIPKDP